MRASLLVPLALLSGCALDAGEGFAVLEPSVRAAYLPGAGRDAGDGYQQLASDFQLRLDGAGLRLADIDLLASSGGGGATSFDPSNPPPGYSLCHGGHCHSDSGALVPYEEVEAQLGGGATTQTVASLPVDTELDLLAPETRALACEPDCELPQTTVSRGRWAVTGLRLSGAVRDHRVPARFPGERAFRLDMATAGAEAEPVAVLDGTLDVPSDRENKPRVTLGLRLDVTPELFDTLDWSSATPGADGVVDLNTAQNTALREALLERLAELGPEAEVTREDR